MLKISSPRALKGRMCDRMEHKHEGRETRSARGEGQAYMLNGYKCGS